jgi:hypothetical protein
MLEKISTIAFLCGLSLVFNFFLALALYSKMPLIIGYEDALSHSIYVSVLAALSFFIINSVDNARCFGVDRLKIPRTMKRHTVMMIAVCGLIIAALSLSPLLVAAFEAIWGGVVFLLSAISDFLEYFFSQLTVPSEGIEEVAAGRPADMPPLPEDEVIPDPIPGWLLTAMSVFIIGLTVFSVLFMAAMLFTALYKYLKKIFTRQTGWEDDFAYVEIVEKADRIRKKRRGRPRKLKLRPKYPAGASERERVRFIYREYVGKAKSAAYTTDPPGGTPGEILYGIGQKAAGSDFPQPDGLGSVYNAASYGHSNTEVAGADELKKRLL